MDDAHWHHLKALFFEIADLPEDQRTARLRQIDDPELRDALQRLLDAEAEPPALLDASPEALAQLVETPPEPVTSEEHVGPYRILNKLGRGGMGTVYLAERADGTFRQRVALKVIRPGLDTEDILRRFRMERQILASLTHPNIARILDGGSTEAGAGPGATGRPYFVMEYIEGAPITTYCDTHRLSIDDRLALFRNVCEAVHYAHQNLIVHRDLKPSNILVTDKGTVKLLDFGIAKLLNPDLPGYSVPMTRTEWRVMTPEYASPEQVRGETITTASDVYALGVLLYELLTGRRPYHLTSRLEQEILRVICEVEPERPSTAVSQAEEVRHADGQTESITPEHVSRARSTQVERLRRRLRGDLDNIVLKALKKEPSRRYASAEQLAEDVRRYAVGLPVAARRETMAYRVGKFVRRHRVGVLAAGLIVLSLLGGLSAALWQARAKTLEAARAEAVKALVLDLFEQADPDVAQGEVMTALDLAAQGAVRVRETLDDQPEVQSEMLVVLAEVYRKLAEYDEALDLLENALALRRAQYGAEHEQTAEVLDRLGRLQIDRGAYDTADSLLTEALHLRRAQLGEEHNDVAETLYNLGALRGAGRQGREEEAVVLFRQALEIRQRILDEDDPDLLRTLHGLAIALSDQGDPAAAEPLLRDLLQRQRRALGEKHPETLRTMHVLGSVLGMQMKHDETIAILREALALSRDVLGDEHPDVAGILFALAVQLHNRQRPEDAAEIEALHREALAIRRATLGDEHPNVATSLASLALALTTLGRYEDAVPPAREALAIHRKTLGEEHRRLVVDLLFLARALQESGAYTEAEQRFTEAHDMALRTWPTDHLIVGDILVHQGMMFQEQNRYREAEPLLEEGIRILEKNLSSPHEIMATAKLHLGRGLYARQAYAAAEPLLLEALTLYDQVEAPEGSAHTRAALAELYTVWGQPEKAQAYQSN